MENTKTIYLAGSSRKSARRIARAKMQKAGLRRVNKIRYNARGMIMPSFFSQHWREYAAR